VNSFQFLVEKIDVNHSSNLRVLISGNWGGTYPPQAG
jgi:hypothetical protein